MEGCLSFEWWTHASTFLPRKHSPRRWTETLVRQLWFIAFDMWENCNKDLHKNDLSNKIHDLVNIGIKIRSFLQTTNLHLLPHQRKLFQVTVEEIFDQSPKYCREWLKKRRISKHSFESVLLTRPTIKGNALSCNDG